MTWVRLDDRFHSHPKVLEAWRADPTSLGLHMLALSHSSAYLTDGHVDRAFVAAALLDAAERRRAVAALVKAGLWERNGKGWVIHDYLDFNEPRADVLARRRARAQPPTRAQARASRPDPTKTRPLAS